jgi:hypothetical protein
MIKSFNTASAPSTGGGATSSATSSATPSGGGSMNKIIMAVVVLGAIYVGYRFVIKPMMDAKKANQDAE